MQSNSDFCLFPGLGLHLPLALRPSSVSPAYGAWQRSPGLAFGSNRRLLLHERRNGLRLGRLRLHDACIFCYGLHHSSHARAHQHAARIRPRSSSLRSALLSPWTRPESG